MFRRFFYAIGLLAGLIPTVSYAQTSIDAGKSPGEIFQTVCTTCHKSARGLANGRGSSGLASFLAEHYTSGKDQAAQLAAYVMGAGGGEAAPATQGRKPASDSSRTATEESKPSPQRQKPDAPGSAAKLQPSGSEEPKRPGDVPSIVQERGRKPAAGQPATANRGKPTVPEPAEAKPAAPEPARAAAAVEPPKPSVQESTPAPAAAPANADAGETAPVPRDNIPD